MEEFDIIELRSYNHELAFILGNGINIAAYNRERSNDTNVSWSTMLQEMWDEFGNKTRSLPKIESGISYTELYDIIDINSRRQELTDWVIKKFSEIEPVDFHHQLVRSLKDWNVPVLTTNFDRNLERCLDMSQPRVLYHPKGKKEGYKFSGYYPWNTYSGRYYDDYTEACYRVFDELNIWHINGSVQYKQSIKLGLTQYLAQCQHARQYLHSKDSPIDNFAKKDVPFWKGMNSWLHLIFNKSLCIVGLTLDTNEVFLRWLLIERKKFLDRKHYHHKGWFIDVAQDGEGQEKVRADKRFFLESVGFNVVTFDTYDDIYDQLFGI